MGPTSLLYTLANNAEVSTACNCLSKSSKMNYIITRASKEEGMQLPLNTTNLSSPNAIIKIAYLSHRVIIKIASHVKFKNVVKMLEKKLGEKFPSLEKLVFMPH